MLICVKKEKKNIRRWHAKAYTLVRSQPPAHTDWIFNNNVLLISTVGYCQYSKVTNESADKHDAAASKSVKESKNKVLLFSTVGYCQYSKLTKESA